MKLLHLGDLHLGKSLFEYDLIDDQAYILDQILSVAKEQEVEGILIAGDVYDKTIPSEAAVHLFDEFLKKMVKENIKAFVISGNHDSDERLNFGSSLFEVNDIFISAKYNGELYKRTLEDEHGKINFYLLPFVKGSQVRQYYKEAEIENYDDAVRTIMEHTDINTEERNILVAHQFVSGKSGDPELSGSESLPVQTVGLMEKVGADSFDKFDYVALGHIHSAQQVGRETIRYAGSPLKYSLSEVHHRKVVTVVNIEEKGNVSYELIELKPRRDLRHIVGSIEDLTNPKNVVNPDDFIYVTLTNEDMQENAMAIFQGLYPNTVKVDYKKDDDISFNLEELSDSIEDKSFSEIIGEFYKSLHGNDLSEEELKVLLEVAKEVGIVDEAN